MALQTPDSRAKPVNHDPDFTDWNYPGELRMILMILNVRSYDTQHFKVHACVNISTLHGLHDYKLKIQQPLATWH
ncbi:unnamed protein product [Ambrosiozyma monospora]|uniref:Unnamed protein product n=1 Tax=Ambrosiozyma monospora TaxID=43982 RepID=A0A9W6Z099_AMBMO|nr:unnamed protein product [Ambrosiozyma monospora]